MKKNISNIPIIKKNQKSFPIYNPRVSGTITKKKMKRNVNNVLKMKKNINTPPYLQFQSSRLKVQIQELSLKKKMKKNVNNVSVIKKHRSSPFNLPF
jgi:hypothetical protein